MSVRLLFVSLLLLSALGLGLIGYQTTRPARVVTVAAPPPPPPVTVEVLVATRGLPAGTLLKDDDFSPRAAPPDKAPQGAVKNSTDVRGSLRGALLRRYLDAGATLMLDDVLHPRDRGFLAAVMAPGDRAISIGVDAVSGNGGLIWPGDRVDVILTQELDEKDAPLARRFVGETVLNNARVVAVDQSIAQGAVAGGDNAMGRIAHTVTLEVTPEEAERAAVAERLGKITLAIRSADATMDAVSSRASVYSGDVSPALVGAGTVATSHMRVIEGQNARDVLFQ